MTGDANGAKIIISTEFFINLALIIDEWDLLRIFSKKSKFIKNYFFYHLKY
jgi:hypothetical protein